MSGPSTNGAACLLSSHEFHWFSRILFVTYVSSRFTSS